MVAGLRYVARRPRSCARWASRRAHILVVNIRESPTRADAAERVRGGVGIRPRNHVHRPCFPFPALTAAI